MPISACVVAGAAITASRPGPTGDDGNVEDGNVEDGRERVNDGQTANAASSRRRAATMERNR